MQTDSMPTSWRPMTRRGRTGIIPLMCIAASLTAADVSSAQAVFLAPPARDLDPEAGLSVILLGTGIPIPNPERAAACTAVVAGDRVFLVDTGRNCVVSLSQAGIRDLEGVFYTHYHADHVVGLGEILLNFGIAGVDKALPVRGPRGVQEVVSGIEALYRLDEGYRISHHGAKFSDRIMHPAVTELQNGLVFDEGGLEVSMFPVCHAPIEPAVGYRFTYRGKTVVISGDTSVCDAYAEGARDADLLVSEVSNARLWSRASALARATGNARQVEMIEEGVEYHAESLALARMAQEVGVKKLALTHFFPSIPPTDQAEAMFIEGMSDRFDGPIVVGRDGMEVMP